MSRKSNCFMVVLIITAVVLFILALVSFILLFVFDRLFLSMLAKNTVLQPGSPLFDNWLSPSVPIWFKVYMLNLTNADEVLAGGRPHFQEVDPNNVKITTPNLFCLSPDARWITLLTSCQPFTTITAEEAMWGYYPSSLLEVAGKKVGLFIKLNGTDVHEFVVDVGVENIQNIGQIYEADGKKKLTIWDNDEANMIIGTDGSLASPGLQVGSTVTFYVPEICRSTTLYATGKKSTVNLKDVEIIVFTGDPADPTEHIFEWRNRIFCQTKAGCPPKGLVSLEPCLKSEGVDMPMYLSQPSFIGADPRIGEHFDGLSIPNPDKHVTTVHIEPTTGFLLEAFKRVQFNILMRNTDKMFKKMKSGIYFPIGRIEETAVADKRSLEEIYNRILLPRKQIPIILSVVCAVTTLLAVIIILSLAIYLRCSKRNTAVDPATPSTSSTMSLKEELGFKISVITIKPNWGVRPSKNYLQLG
ncbi:Lysosome membrane protein 2 [Paragonimus heterotremus]|uniref:Scavenger receptor class B member 1 n=1 Tax=Paragonimus heterotremus TaxID=100268 RepID=A0A8J4WRK1_9TREM|nr:Lysosome membrane protein 2 [Paragonimus heterotremus]